MSMFIRETRKARGLTLRQLGTRLGVTTAAVQQYELAEESGSIQVKTLERVLLALDAHLNQSVDLVDPELRREEKYNLAIHREIAKKLIDDPPSVLDIARRNLPKIEANVKGRVPKRIVDEWHGLLSGSTGDLIAAMLDESRHGSELRQNTPFAGVLSQAERLEIARGRDL